MPALVLLLFACSHARAQEQPKPLEVPLCELIRNPAAYEKRFISVRGNISLEFEDFSISSATCKGGTPIWLAFAGDVATPTPSTANDTWRVPGQDLEVDGASLKLKKDETFRKFYALLTAVQDDKPFYRVTATLTGTFLASKEIRNAQGQVEALAGYGHLGCCSLFIISEVSEVTSAPPNLPDLAGRVIGPNGKPAAGVVVVNETASCCQPQRQETTTDEDGRFTVKHPGQALLVRMAAFRPLTVVTPPMSLRIQLQLENAAPTDWIIPPCSVPWDPTRRVGFRVRFHVRPGMYFQEEKFGDQVAYGVSLNAESFIAGVHISLMSTEREFVINTHELAVSESYEQRWVKDVHGKILGIDARGRYRHGLWWRHVSFFGREFATYTLNEKAELRPYDEVIDSACIREP